VGAGAEWSAAKQEGEEPAPPGIGPPTKKAMSLVLDEAEAVELIRILMDDDADGALDFLKLHFKGKARDLLEGG
jgi:hypothetical protein